MEYQIEQELGIEPEEGEVPDDDEEDEAAVQRFSDRKPRTIFLS